MNFSWLFLFLKNKPERKMFILVNSIPVDVFGIKTITKVIKVDRRFILNNIMTPQQHSTCKDTFRLMLNDMAIMTNPNPDDIFIDYRKEPKGKYAYPNMEYLNTEETFGYMFGIQISEKQYIISKLYGSESEALESMKNLLLEINRKRAEVPEISI